MQNTVRLLGLSGSLRKESYSTAILKTLAESVAAQAQISLGDIGSLPHYNQDQDGDNSPASVVAMRKSLGESQGLIIVSPEYNYSMPGVVKNAIDWLSRPAFKSALVGKPFLIITSSPAFTGGVRAQAQLREALMAAMARPVVIGEIVIATVHTKITNGKLTDPTTLDFALKGVHHLIAEAQARPTAQAA
jgi:chromate reductase